MSGGVSELFALGAAWAVAKGAANLNQIPGVWTGQLGEFDVSINGSNEDRKTADGFTVPPISMLFNNPKYLGAILLVGPSGGAGAPGMEDDLIALLKAAVQ